MKKLLLLLLLIIGCEENSTEPADCAGVAGGTAVLDDCGVCNGGNYIDEVCGNCAVSLWDDCYNIEETIIIQKPYGGLYGNIPPDIGYLVNLTDLYVSFNNITGTIPQEIGSLANLTSLGISHTNISGELPSEIMMLSNLEYLWLNDNNLQGILHETICDLSINWSNQVYFNISNNQICPPYPSCIEDYVGTQDTTNCP